MEQIKFDIHQNVGTIPKTKKKVSQTLHIPPARLAEFNNKYKITHAVVLYNDYADLEELDRLTPNTKIYGLQWINYPETMPEIHSDKPLWVGLKFHSHRCYRTTPEGEDQIYGLQYASEAKLIQKILDKLPPNAVINFHLQGSASLFNQANARSLYKFALANPMLKFIISHAGCYGKGSFAPVPKYFPPTTAKDMSKEQKYHNSMLMMNHFSTLCVEDAVFVAEALENTWLNTAVFYPVKREPLKKTRRWGIGSDYPFCAGTPTNWEQHSYDTQVSLARNYFGEQAERESHQLTLDWFNKDLSKAIDKQWIAMFSRSGSELLNLSKRLDRVPDVVFTTKSPEKCKETEFYQYASERGTLFFQLKKELKVNDYITIFEDFGINPGWDVITLNGFLRVLPGRLVNRYPMVNLHPGLITKYEELKGMDPQQKVIDNIDDYDEIGCVIHQVTKKVDDGEILASDSKEIPGQKHLMDVYGTLAEIALDLWESYLIENLQV